MTHRPFEKKGGRKDVLERLSEPIANSMQGLLYAVLWLLVLR